MVVLLEVGSHGDRAAGAAGSDPPGPAPRAAGSRVTGRKGRRIQFAGDSHEPVATAQGCPRRGRARPREHGSRSSRRRPARRRRHSGRARLALARRRSDERDPEARPDAAARAQQDRHQAEVADSRRREILGRLNPEQARAVTTTEGPVLILAGAGSGKTRVLAHRIAYLVGVKRVAPFRILAVTFTNRAAGELRERIIRLVGEPGKEVQAGTFHSICARVLRRDGEAIGLDRRFVIYDTEDQQQLMKQILREEGLDAKGETRPRRSSARSAGPRTTWSTRARSRRCGSRPARPSRSRGSRGCTWRR